MLAPEVVEIGSGAFYNAPVPTERNDEAAPSRPSFRERVRPYAPLVLVAFLGVGVWLVTSKTPKDVSLRLVVPPTLRAEGVSFPRELTVSLGGRLLDDAQQEVGSFDVPLPRGLETPLAPPVALSLRKGRYAALVTARSHDGQRVELVGRFEVDGSGELRVELGR